MAPIYNNYQALLKKSLQIHIGSIHIRPISLEFELLDKWRYEIKNFFFLTFFGGRKIQTCSFDFLVDWIFCCELLNRLFFFKREGGGKIFFYWNGLVSSTPKESSLGNFSPKLGKKKPIIYFFPVSRILTKHLSESSLPRFKGWLWIKGAKRSEKTVWR